MERQLRAGASDVSRHSLNVRGRKVDMIEAGEGDPLVYLHGFADVHGVAADLSRFTNN